MGQRDEIIAREKMLKTIRQAIIVSKEHPFEDFDLNAPVFEVPEEIGEVVFAHNFIQAGGQFVFCDNIADMHERFKELVNTKNWTKYRKADVSINHFMKLSNDVVVDAENCTGEEVSITQCDFLAARTGSILISSNICPDKLAWSFCGVHIVIAASTQVVDDLTKAYALLKDKYKNDNPSLVSVITGPSRTADIEKQLVMGAHGPRELYLFLIDDISDE
jgi:L-lactate dehydrogenase complex protein LldG